MSRKKTLFPVLALAVAACAAWWALGRRPDITPRSLGNIGANADLAAHSREFERKVYRVTDNVYSAVGFGLANSILIEGKDGVIIVDTLENMNGAREVLAEFRKITDKPVRAIVYTHNHTDHIFGALAFAGDGNPEVFAHKSLDALVGRIVSQMRPIISTRSLRMFGNFLDREGVVNDGIGPFLSIHSDAEMGYLRPTRTLDDRLDAEVAGVRFTLIHAPGETDDQINLWLPDQKVLLCGDNFYRAFPNLYTIRGTPYRSLRHWYESLDLARDLNPDYLVPSHGRPISGAETIQAALTDYRDAIQYVHDQGIRCINQGMTPDQMVENVKLPPHLARSPYLAEHYGKVTWSLRSLFSGNLGWFNGDSATLQPLPPKARAGLLAEIAGGTDKLLEHAAARLEKGDPQAALELTSPILVLEPDNEKAKQIRIQALTELGEGEENANARHYYLTEALEIRDGFVSGMEQVKASPRMVAQLPLEGYFQLMAVNLDPVKSADMDRVVGIRFPDKNETYTIHIRRGVAEIRKREPENPEILVSADSTLWKEMLARLRNPAVTLARFDYEKGNVLSFGKFLKLFETPPMQPVTPPLEG